MKTVTFISRIVAGAALLLPFLWGCKAEKPALPEIDLEAPVLIGAFNGQNIILEWEPVLNALSFKIEGKDATAAEYHAIGAPTYSPFTVPETEVEFGHSYSFRIKAISGDVESEWSNVVTVAVTRNLPLPVVRCSAGFTMIEVEWDAVEGATSYKVEHKTTIGSEYTTDYTGNGEDAGYKVKIEGLESGVSYDVRIAAIAEGYADTYCDPVTVATTAAPSALISTADQLIAWLGSISEQTFDVVALEADIDMTGKTITSASGFSGTLHGQDHVISNLTSSVPLFAENSGVIRNLTLDGTCVFTPSPDSEQFGALVGLDNGGTYTNVNTAASITITATGNITNNIALGGLVGASDSESGSTFDHCSNSGAITIDATAYTHWAVAMAGIVGWTRKSTFDYCTNSGPVSLYAKYAESWCHQWSFVSSETTDEDGNVSVAGICGRALDHEKSPDIKSSYNHCENLATGAITLNHDGMNVIPNIDKTGCLNVAGICGESNGTMESCVNYAPITAIAICPANNDYWGRRNALLKVGGIAGLSWEGVAINSCSNRGAINVNYDGSWEKSPRNMSAVGGIIGKQGYGLSNAKVTFSTNHGPITVTGNGHVAVGGITGSSGSMRGNRVYDTAPINVSCKAGYVGGLLGLADGSSQYQFIRTSYCEADITAENIWDGDRYKVCVGGLIGYFATGATGSYPSLVPYSSDPQRCHYTGNIVSTGQLKVGMVIGWITNNNEKVFGTSETPIQVTGTLYRWGLDSSTQMSEPLTIHAGNVEDYAIGVIKEGTVTIYVECVNNN